METNLHVKSNSKLISPEVVMTPNLKQLWLTLCLIIISFAVHALPNWDASPSRKYSFPQASPAPRQTEICRADSAHGFNVQKYVITLNVNDTTHQISGNVLANVIATSNLTSITYELRSLTVSSVLVNGSPAVFTHTGQNLVINCDIINGQGFTTQVFYSGTPQLTSDIYHIGMIFGTNTVFTISDPDAARNWWPCYDHPWDKAVVDLHITMRSDWKVAANGIRTQITNNGNGTTTTDWIGQHPMTTYLVCITAGPYVEINQTVPQLNNLPVKNFVMQNQYDNALTDFQHLPDMIAYFSQKFGDYPFEKYGNATVNMSTYGAMEHQTMTTLGNYIITGTQAYEPTIAHELAHQWYGDAASFLTFKDVWLSEGFATYSEQLWTDYRFGWQTAVSYVTSAFHQYYLSYENSAGPQTIYDPDFNNYFMPPSYEKAASVLHMLRLKMGDAQFFQLLQQFFTTYCHGNAITAEFQAMAELISGQDLDQFFNQWIYGSGIPSLTYSIWTAEDIDDLVVLAKTNSPTNTAFHVEVPFRFSHGAVNDSLLVIASPTGHSNHFIYSTAGINLQVTANYNDWAFLNGITELRPQLTECLPSNGSVLLSWPVFIDGIDQGYQVERKLSNGSDWVILNATPIGPRSIVDNTVQNGLSYDYRLRVWDHNGYLSSPSPSVTVVPVACNFSQNLLVVDETRDGNGANINPDDAMVDSFYAAALQGLNSPVNNWDCASQGLPGLADLGSYKVVLWHADDFSQNLLQDNLSALSGYIIGGGKLVLSGWKTASILSPAFLERFAAGITLIYDNSPYLISANPANGTNWPSLTVDPAKTLPNWNGYLPYIYTFSGATNSLYTANMAAGSNGNGQSLAFRYDNGGSLVLFGLPLYFMQPDGVHDLLLELLPWLDPALPNADGLAPVRPANLTAYPNPFNPSTMISLYQPLPGKAVAEIFNLKGQKVSTLLDEALPAGLTQLSFFGTDPNGSPLASGIYILRYRFPGGELKKKLTLMK